MTPAPSAASAAGARPEPRTQEGSDAPTTARGPAFPDLGPGDALPRDGTEKLMEKLTHEKVYLEEEVRAEGNFEEIVGDSAALRRDRKSTRLNSSHLGTS